MQQAALYHNEMKCNVVTIKYDYATKTGTVTAGPTERVNMEGTIAFFKRVDVGVQQIRTYSGTERSSTFRLVAGSWKELKQR